MRPANGPRPFDDPGYFFEPWWPGVSVLAFVEEHHLRLQAEELADVLGTFPELGELVEHVEAERAVVEGVVMVIDRSGRPDQRLLHRRLAGDEDRTGHAAFIATDLLIVDDHRLTARGFASRRERLSGILQEGEWCVVSRGYPGEGHTLAAAASELGFAAVSAHRLAARYRHGQAGDAWLRLPVDPGTIPATPERRLPPILAVFSRLPL